MEAGISCSKPANMPVSQSATKYWFRVLSKLGERERKKERKGKRAKLNSAIKGGGGG